MCLYPVKIRPYKKGEPRGSGEVVTVKCGKCLECERQHSLEWAYRIMDECSNFEHNCMITLTYNQENLPSPPSVSRREVQLFMKSLRYKLKPLRIRFFACGEYGKKNGRPHYHFIIFNWFPPDAYEFDNEGDIVLYRSPTLEEVWTKGFSSVGYVTEKSALYCAKYLNKLSFSRYPQSVPVVVDGEVSPFRDPLLPPFVQMSNRPGIGFNSVYKCDLNSDRIYRNGKGIKIPRYYLKIMERDGIYLDEFKERRKLQGELVERSTDLNKRIDRANSFLRDKIFVKRLDR